jgi:hypothetical protein
VVVFLRNGDGRCDLAGVGREEKEGFGFDNNLELRLGGVVILSVLLIAQRKTVMM